MKYTRSAKCYFNKWITEKQSDKELISHNKFSANEWNISIGKICYPSERYDNKESTWIMISMRFYIC